MLDRGVLSRVVAIANGKGGVGKTSLATTLGGLAAAAGYRILLIDLDPQGNVGEDLGYTGSGTGDDGAGLVTALVAGSPIAVTLPGTGGVLSGLNASFGGLGIEPAMGRMKGWPKNTGGH